MDNNIQWLNLELKMQKYKFRVWQVAILLLIVLVSFIWTNYNKGTHGLLEVSVWDVGQGDAIFIRTSEDYQILIDGGPDSAILEKISGELPFWDRSLDLVVLTHPHADHLSGLLDVVERYQIDQIMITDPNYSSSEFSAWKKYLKVFSGKIVYAKAGQEISANNFNMQVIYPFSEPIENSSDDLNNTSIVLKLKYGDFSMLFTGDAECEEQDQILQQGKNVDIDVLKVAHHGSRNGTCENFLKMVSPAQAIISAGQDNSFGHPHAEALALLEQYIPDRNSQEIYRTDKDGDIRIFSDQKQYWIKSEK